MANRTVSAVDVSELEAAKTEFYGAAQPKSITPENFQIKENKPYVLRLKEEEIEKFFKPFDLIGFYKDEESKLLGVCCEAFNAAISDFEVVIMIDGSVKLTNNDKKSFDFHSFCEYCDTIGLTPEQVLTYKIQTELLGNRFHSYGRDLENDKSHKRKKAQKALPEHIKKLFPIANEMAKVKDTAITNKIKYGQTSNPYSYEN